VPTLARLADGRLIAAHQHFPADNNSDFDKVAVRFSSDEGRTWTAPQVIRLAGLPQGMRFPFDPTLVPLPDGRVRLYFTSVKGRTFQDDRPAIYSAISSDGVDYTVEPGVRFGVEGRPVIDCAVVFHQGVFHLYAPDNGVGGPPGMSAQRAREGVGYHATSRDGLTFKRQPDLQIQGRRRWLGNAQSDDEVIRFFGTAEGGPGRPGGVWSATSVDGNTWKLDEDFVSVPGADPGAVKLKDGGWLVVVTGPPRPGTAGVGLRGPGRKPPPDRWPPDSRRRPEEPEARLFGGSPQPPPRSSPQERSAATPEAPIRVVTVNAARTTGEIRSLLGVNRGPLSWPREPGAPTVSHVESYRRFGIDFIRTHDFYGPTDWHAIFPRWEADPTDPASYDFRSSDERIRAIVEHGFRCFYRLGTSWRGRRLEPINDPPGTRRDALGRVTHVADRADFQKWAVIAAHTVRHYTEGWNNGFQFPIEYWEVWNEPDLAAQFWTGTSEQYYQLYEETARAIKAVNPKLKVGGPACTGGLREAYVERFLRYCAEHNVPLDFFSWHSYGGRGEFNPYQFRSDAERIRHALDDAGFPHAENINTEWNAGIQRGLFSHTPSGAAFYASVLANLLDADVDHAFQYCGDQHPGLGLHEMRSGAPKICAYAFAAWKQLLETPERLEATGSDHHGYNVVAGKSADNRRVQVLVSDFQSTDRAFRLQLNNLPWPAHTRVSIKRWLLDDTHRLSLVEEASATGHALTLERPFGSGSVCLVELRPD